MLITTGAGFVFGNVYVGSIVADLSTLGARDQGRSPREWTLYGAGFVAALVAVVYLNRLAQRALARYTETGAIDENRP